MSITRAIAIFVAFTSLSSLVAQAGPSTTQPTVHRLSIHPQATTQPALKYRLLPEASEQTPGNGAALYFRAVMMVQQHPEDLKKLRADEVERMHMPPTDETMWLSYYLDEVPFEKLPGEAGGRIGMYSSALSFMDLAARREYVQWDTAVREEGALALLPELNNLHEMARANALRARVLIAQRDYKAAARALQTDLALARSLNEGTVFVQTLVGIGIAGIALDRVDDWVQQPGAPNLYWSLANLPRPFVDLRQTVEAEKSMLLDTVPELKNVQAGRFTDDDWAHFHSRLPLLSAAASSRPMPASQSAADALSALYPAARAYFRGAGLTEAEVDAMPHAQAVGRYLVGDFTSAGDESAKWVALPYWQAEPALRRLTVQKLKDRNKATANVLIGAMRDLGSAAKIVARFDRQIAALQTLEALRAFAAAHAGRLPDKLEDMSDMPAPIDPMTGKVFIYSAHDGTATLESPALGDDASDAVRYEVKLVN